MSEEKKKSFTKKYPSLDKEEINKEIRMQQSLKEKMGKELTNRVVHMPKINQDNEELFHWIKRISIIEILVFVLTCWICGSVGSGSYMIEMIVYMFGLMQIFAVIPVIFMLVYSGSW